MASATNPNLIFKQLILSNFKAPKYAVRNCVCARTSIRSFTNKLLSDTSIMLQSGKDIQELPLVVKKLSSVDVGHLFFCENIKDTHNRTPPDIGRDANAIPHQQEINEIIVGFDKCNTVPEVLKLLELLPSTYVEPAVAFHIMKKMSELDERQTLLSERMGEELPQNFTTAAIFNQLIGTILSGDDRATLINCLKLINQRIAFKNYFEPYHEQLMEKIMLNVPNSFSVAELCDIAEEFHICDYGAEIDKLWVGIAENAKSIDATNIVSVFHVLPYFQTSRNMIMKIVLERMADTWWYLEGKDVVELLSALRNSQVDSHELMLILGRWLNTKIHAVDEDELLTVVKAFADLQFVNGQVIAALERYVKIKLDLIADPNLVAAIMDYCDRFKVRSSIILEKACDYFISKGASLSPTVVKSLIIPFGSLCYAPTRSYEFWKTFEQVLEDKFTRFEPEDVIDIMLSCVCLEKYPINFVNYIFNPYFLTRLQSGSSDWLATKNKLAVFDHQMNVNCASYRGPLLPKEVPTSSIISDRQMRHMLSRLKTILIDEYGKDYSVLDTKILSSCPQDHRCVINIYMHPRSARHQSRLAVLIYTVNDYTYDGQHLVGMQQLRHRHFVNLGFRVIDLNYSKLIAHFTKDDALVKYIKEIFDSEVDE